MKNQVSSVAAAIAERLRLRSCVLFLGDDIGEGARSETTWVTRRILLERMRNTRSFITSDMDLSEALQVKEDVEGRASVLAFLREQLASQNNLFNSIVGDLVTLPFTGVVTTNWSSNYEATAERAGAPLRTVATDRDVLDYRFEGQILLKLLGTLDDPVQYGVVASPADLFDSRPFVGSLFRVLCSNTLLLFIGYSHRDPEFHRLFRWIRHLLGQNFGGAYFVTPSRSRDAGDWSGPGLSMIDSGLIDFVERVHAELIRSGSLGAVGAGDDVMWLENPLFRPLFRVRILPTESQVIEGTVETVLKLLEEDGRPLTEIGKNVLDALKEIVRSRPNQEALANLVSREMVNWFPPAVNSRDQAQLKAERYLRQRKRARDVIAERGSMLIHEGDNLLLYVHSTRVCAVVQRWLDEHRRRSSSLTLIIPEARPRSPRPFQNGLETAHALKSSDARIVLVPDMAVAALMQRGLITKAFFGAHKVIERPDGSFVVTNVTGTQQLCIFAEKWGIPVFFFAEEEKISSEDFDTCTDGDRSLNLPEVSILNINDPILGELVHRPNTTVQNPGFDQVDSKQVLIRLITERRELPTIKGRQDA